jgi:hypothetical protein
MMPAGHRAVPAIEHVAGDAARDPDRDPGSPGASDRPSYAQSGIITYGLDPYLILLRRTREVHGNDERLSIDNVGWGVKFYLLLLSGMR